MAKVKEPVTNGIAKVPVIMQLEALECGAASLTMVLAYYEKWIPLEQVRSDCDVSRDGSSAKNILLAARNYGLDAKAYSFEIDEIKNDASYPCIIHWNFNHFVVLKGFKGKYAYINDPARGEVKVPMNEFDESFTGVCLIFEPTEEFVPSGHKKTNLEYIKERTDGLGAVVLFVFLTTVITDLMGLIQPGLTRIFYDRLLTHQNPEWTRNFFTGMIIIAIVQIVMTLISAIYNNKINGKIAVVGSSSFMWKVLRLPMNFFSQRMAGDILSRQNSNASIANTIVNILGPLIINIVMMVFYFVVMIRFSVTLTAVALIATCINSIVSALISKKRANGARVTMRDAGKLSSYTMSGIEMIETIKSSGAENGYFEKWSGYQAAQNSSTVKMSKDTTYLGLIPQMVTSASSTIILSIGLYLTIKGEFTLGMITAFQGYLSSFLGPVDSLIGANQSFDQMITEMERIDDVMNYPTDFVYDDTDDVDKDNYSKLSGNIEMKNVTFGYSKLGEPLIKDFNLSLKPGSRVAFVGASGCGKSTLSKLISGLVQPWSGEILFDGKSINQIDRSVFTSSVAVVDQDIILFEDTIKNNIKLWDNSIEDFEVILAAKDAQMHEAVMQRPEGYDSMLIEGGKNFSGGQRQRLEIARVLAQDPTICILDEATSALDAKTEYDVINAIKDRGITCVVVAHRLSTIRDSDEIIVLNHGEVVERGTHDELIKKDGYYKELVGSE